MISTKVCEHQITSSAMRKIVKLDLIQSYQKIAKGIDTHTHTHTHSITQSLEQLRRHTANLHRNRIIRKKSTRLPYLEMT